MTRLEALITKRRIAIGLLIAIKAIVSDAIDALKDLPVLERGFYVFWLIGPFILLIERTPADIWLSLIAISFVIRSIIKCNGAWLKSFWVRASFVFWFWCLICGSLSYNPSYSLGETIVWFRFPLFAMATVFWLGRDKRLLYAMLLSTAIGLFLMCVILSAELVIEGQKGGRLTWPYGDLVPGSYVSKAGLPVFTIMMAFAVSNSGRLSTFCGLFSAATLLISLMTGERINFLIRACSGMLAALVWRPKWHRFLILCLIELLAICAAFSALPKLKNRFVDRFIDQLPISQGSPYIQAILPGKEIFLLNPVKGIGPGNFQEACSGLNFVGDKIKCLPHPHNYYVQILAETGLPGLIFGSVFIGSIVWVCFSASMKFKTNIVVKTGWVIPFALFWPIASQPDFFGQWHNIFLWSAVALALSSASLDTK